MILSYIPYALTLVLLASFWVAGAFVLSLIFAAVFWKVVGPKFGEVTPSYPACFYAFARIVGMSTFLLAVLGVVAGWVAVGRDESGGTRMLLWLVYAVAYGGYLVASALVLSSRFRVTEGRGVWLGFLVSAITLPPLLVLLGLVTMIGKG